MVKQKQKIDRSEFLEVLSSLSKEEIANIINTKGKDPKPIKPFIIMKGGENG